MLCGAIGFSVDLFHLIRCLGGSIEFIVVLSHWILYCEVPFDSVLCGSIGFSVVWFDRIQCCVVPLDSVSCGPI